MCNSIVSTGYYLRSHNIYLADLAGMPKTLGGLPKGCVQRLAGDGIICREKGASGRIYRDRAVRVIWKEGCNWDRLVKWMGENDM